MLAKPALSATRSASSAECKLCGARHFGLCAPLSDAEIEHVGILAIHREAPRGTIIFHEADPAHAVFSLKAGTIKLSKLLSDGRRQITGFMYPGDFIGLAIRDSYVYTAEAVTDVHLCGFPKDRFDELRIRLPQIDHRLLELAYSDLVAAQEQMLLLGRKHPDEKVASFLLMLSRHAIARGQPGDPVSLPMSREDIADYLGLRVETVSRVIGRLKGSGMIRLLDGHHVALADHDALRDLAGGG